MPSKDLNVLVQEEDPTLPEALRTHSGIDWVTLTVKSGKARHALYNQFIQHKEELEANGGISNPWKFMGYAGIKIEGVRWGARDDSDIAMISGVDAARYWRDFGQYAEHCSRLDLACTTLLSFSWPDLAKLYYNWHRDGNGQPAMANLTFSLVQSTAGGQTCYVGSRKSAQMGRIYDKGLEEGCMEMSGLLWRYEVEVKKPLAWPVLQALISHDPTSEVHQAVTGWVYEWFCRRDCPPVFNSDSLTLEVETSVRVTSTETRLWWLSTQVAPTVRTLIGQGRWRDAALALGISDRISPTVG